MHKNNLMNQTLTPLAMLFSRNMTTSCHSLRGNWASVEGYYDENVDHKDQTDKLVKETMKTIDNISKEQMKTMAESYTTTFGNLSGLTELINNANFPELLAKLEGFQSSFNTLSIATKEQLEPSSKKLMPASREVRHNLDEHIRVPYDIHGKIYQLTNDEIQAHLDKEKEIKKKAKEPRLLAMTKFEIIKVVHKDAEKARINLKIVLSAKRGEEFKKIQDAEHQKKKNKIVGELMTSLGKRYERLKKIPKVFGIQSALPAPKQAQSQSSKRKRKHVELEPEIKVPGLECNRTLPKNVLFVNNMVIEETKYEMFFIDVFEDQPF
nr:hypothetical protein [Tanacetum cinerariifolium]